ncbi:ABC transporter permease [Nonlabens spongiae]|uniref:ABC transporter permease n=1 Tax=Nonlabens spongiae TaxID=331648 RepID=A0A1W6MMJ2_9FLAO|nr:ABC transporter permease subunit [Nonlabens spongiae]ARN78801.1 ABC transporter permease [Nonlabens spongiae]
MKKVLQILFALSIVFPIGFLVVLSLGRNWPYPVVLPKSLSLENWSFLQQSDSELWQTFLLSLLISIIVATATTALAFVTSKQLAQSKYRNKLMLLAYIPYVLSPVILAATLQYYFIYASLSGSVAGVLLAQVFIAYPFAVIILNNFWNHKIKSMEELSRTLGSSSWQTFKKVLIPVSKNALLLCFFQTFLISWFEFGLTNLIGVGSVQTLTVKVFSYVNEANIFYAALASCLLIVPPMILIWLNKKYIFATETVI